MLTIAAISYTIDQNGPSRPFLLELDLSDWPTVNQLRDALVTNEGVTRRLLTDPDGEPLAGEQLRAVPPLLVGREHRYGDLVVGAAGEDTFLFVVLPDRLGGLAESFPDHRALGI